MKKILFLAFLLASVTSFAQFSNYTNINGRYKWIAGKFDSTFTIPTGTTPSLRTGGANAPGAMFYRTTDSTIYQYTGTQWIKLRGSLNPTDTAGLWITNLYRKTGSDSVFYVKGGTHTFAFRDSVENAGGGGGGGKIYYFNGGVSMGTIGGLSMYELGDTANTGAAANFTRATTGNLANFITDPNKPGLLQIPAGVWTVDAYLSETGGGANHAQIWIEVEKWDGSTITTIATSPIEEITNGSVIDLYTWSVSIPTTSLAITDRIVIQFYISNTNGKTVTLYTQNGYVGEVHTTFTTGIGSLNGLTAPSQFFATGTSGTDFNIASATATHTFNLPTASATNRGALSTTDWTTFNNKIGGTGTTNYIPKFTSSSAIGNSNIYQDNAGNIGINTTSPQSGIGAQWVDLRSSGIAGFQAIAQTTGTVLRMYAFEGGGGSPSHGSYIGNQSNHWLGFITNNNEKMRLDASGNLGLGTTTFPTFSNTTQLVVRGGTAPSIIQSVSNDKGSSITLYSGNNSSDNPAVIYQKNLRFASVTDDGLTGYSERMRLDASGNLGLGVTPSAWASPTYRAFQIGSTAALFSASGQVLLDANSYVSSAFLDIYSSTGFATRYQQISGQHRWFTAPSGTAGNAISFTQAMTLDASGRLGIGATSLFAKLQINASGAGIVDNTILENTNAAAANLGSALTFAGVGTVAQTVIRGAWDGSATTDAYMSFLTRGSNSVQERMRITSGGSVGIGTTAPRGNFDVSASGNVNQWLGSYFTGTVAEPSFNFFRSNNNTVGTLTATVTGQSLGRINFIGVESGGNTDDAAFIRVVQDGNVSSFRVPAYMDFGTGDATNNPTTRMRITSGGNVGIGTTSPAQQLEIKGAAGANTTIQITSNNSNDFSSRIFFADNVSQRGYIAYSNFSNFLAFGTNSAEVARFTSAGELLINTTSDAGDYKLQVNGNVLSTNQIHSSKVTNQSTISNTTTDASLLLVAPTTTSYYGGTIGWAEGNIATSISAYDDGSGGALGLVISTGNNTTLSEALRISSTQNATFAGSIKTAAPSGGTAKPWKLGTVATVSPTSPDRTIEVEIDGVTYYIHAKTTNN